MHQSAIPGNWHYFIARKTKEVETMIDLAKSTGFGSHDRGLVVKFLSILLFAAFVAGLANTSYARTTRSCRLQTYMHVEQFQRPNGQWVNASHRQGILVNAGNLIFRASAPGASHNLARMRASKKAEGCRKHWWDGRYCGAHSTSYGDDYRRVGIRTLMNRTICQHVIALGRADLLDVTLRGPLVAQINGDRCCYDSNRRCPYNYGAARAGSVYTGPFIGTELWPGVTHYVVCRRP
jgi:hypothetical protein